MLKALYDYGVRRQLALPPGFAGKTIKAYISLSESDDRVSVYLVRLSEGQLTEAESRQVSLLLQVQSEFERIGDYAINVQECAQRLYDMGGKFSSSALEEIQTMSDAVSECTAKALEAFRNNDITIANGIEPLEEVVRDID